MSVCNDCNASTSGRCAEHAVRVAPFIPPSLPSSVILIQTCGVHPSEVGFRACASCLREARETLSAALATIETLMDRAERAEAALAKVHAALGRGDHGPAMNASCALDAVATLRERVGEAEARAERAEATIERMEAAAREAECALAHVVGDFGEDGPEEVPMVDPRTALLVVREALAAVERAKAGA